MLYLLHNWRYSCSETLASVHRHRFRTRSAARWHAAAQALAVHQILHGWFVSLLIDECDGQIYCCSKLLTGSNVEEEDNEGASRCSLETKAVC